jgi:uncharacterized protein
LKYLLLLLIVLGVVSWVRWQRRQGSGGASTQQPPNTPQDMLPCAHCGVHVPHRDTVAGQRGVYCSAEHRRQHEG